MISQLIKYGGVSGKVKAMYGKRITEEDMERLSSMSTVPEIAAYLKNHPGWSESLKDISVSDMHRGVLEDRLRYQIYIDFKKVSRFLLRNDLPLIRQLNREELNQILLYLRYLRGGRPHDYVYDAPQGFDGYSKVDFSRLSQCGNYLDFLEIVRPSEYYKPLLAIPPAPGNVMPEYNTIETMLNNYFYRAFLETVDKYYSGAMQKRLRKAMGTEIDIINITRTIRIRRYFPSVKGDLFDYLIPVYHKFKRSYLKSVVNAANDDEEAAVLRSGPYGNVFESKSFESIEDYYYEILDRFNYKSLYEGIPSIYTPIAYLSLKEAEMKKLIKIIEKVRYNVV